MAISQRRLTLEEFLKLPEVKPAREYIDGLENIAGLANAVRKLGTEEAPGRIASSMEFILEGLHLSNRLNKDVQGRRILFRG